MPRAQGCAGVAAQDVGMPRAQGCAGVAAQDVGMPRAQGCAGVAAYRNVGPLLVIHDPEALVHPAHRTPRSHGLFSCVHALHSISTSCTSCERAVLFVPL